MTYGEFRNKVFRLSHALVGRGYGVGDVACIHCCNIPEFIIVQQAAVAAGMAVTLCNSLYSSYEVSHQLKDSSSVVIFTQADQAVVDKCVKASYDNNSEAPDKPVPTGVKEIFTLSAEKLEVSTDTRGIKLMHYLDLLTPDTVEFNKKLPSVKIDWKTTRAFIPYSSGTTGLSKGVALTNYNMYYQVKQVTELVHFEPQDAFFAIPPLYHIYGSLVSGLVCPLKGLTTLLQQRFDFVTMLKGIQDFKVTKLALVPPIILAMAKHPVVEKFDLSSVNEILCGAAPMPAEQIKIACDRINPKGKIVFTQGYGMSESGGASSGTPPDAPYEYIVQGSVGIAIPGSEMKIMSIETGETELCGVEGEVCMRAPSLMQCYLNREEETKNTIMSDGWLRSGDLGYMNEEGYLWITDRLKELIKFKGFQVPPAQLEAVLLTHPAVQDCAVIGIPEESAGELPRAYVKVKEGFEGKVTESEIQAYVKERVAPFKQLKGGVAFIDVIPKSAAGKLLRRVLKENYLKEHK
ncbi:uncharacterized protein LOC134851050 isoform X2 [Symsagittifera roscoffensis]